MLLDRVQNDDVAVQFVASLLVDKATKVLSLAELRRSLCKMLEESLISLVKTFKHFLYGLTMKESAADALGKM